MQSLGWALVVIAGLAWVLGGNAILGPRRLRRGEKPLVFDFRPLARLSDLNSVQKRRLLGLLIGAGVLALLGLAMAQGAFDR